MSKTNIKYRDVVGFLPIYKDDIGNCTRVLLENGEIIYKNSLKSFLNRLCKYYFLDLKEIQLYYGEILGAKNTVPIPFDKKVFMPVKYRKPRVKNDGAIGYLWIDYIEDFKRKGSKVDISLIDGRRVFSSASFENFNKHYKNAYIVKRFSKLDLVNELYNYPATKGDIEFLIREVREIKQRIK